MDSYWWCDNWAWVFLAVAVALVVALVVVLVREDKSERRACEARSGVYHCQSSLVGTGNGVGAVEICNCYTHDGRLMSP